MQPQKYEAREHLDNEKNEKCKSTKRSKRTHNYKSSEGIMVIESSMSIESKR